MEEMENFEIENIEHIDEEKEIKTKKKKGKWINIVSNIFFIPVMVILVIYLCYAISIQKENGVPSFFGQSYVKVLSGSMRATGFEKDDVVVIERVKLSEIKAGPIKSKKASIIAFYKDSTKSKSEKNSLLQENQKPANFKDYKTGKEAFKTAIIFHQVVGIYYDANGNIWFETQGTSVSSSDSYLVSGDHVIGQYKDSPMAGLIQFISSSKGMIVLIIIPSCVLLF